MTQGPTQLELDLRRAREADRNAHLGGRSFYFFDFDDNVAFLATPLILFHKDTGAELSITSGEYAREQGRVGQAGPYRDYEFRWDDTTGTFRNFRDHQPDRLHSLGRKKQVFIEDVAEALGHPDWKWKGPSWSCFYHATFNQRPVSLITARGHDPRTLVAGIDLFVQSGHLPERPNYLSLYPVSHPEIRKKLGDTDLNLSTARLKQMAIRASVLQALQKYGFSPHHRFGMSDDDPRNIQLVVEEMRRLKIELPEMKFFMIETHQGDFVKHEVTPNTVISQSLDGEHQNEFRQFSLFPETTAPT